MLRRLYCNEAPDATTTRGAGDAYMDAFVAKMGAWEFIKFVWRHAQIVTGGCAARPGMKSEGLAAGESVPGLSAWNGKEKVTLASLMAAGRPVVLNFGSCS